LRDIFFQLIMPPVTPTILIIGAGPAGLFCAITVAAVGLSVRVLEKNQAPVKKMLLSGSGKCNVTNAATIDDFLRHYGDHPRFVKNALYNFTNSDLMEFFRTRNAPLTAQDDGKVFPASMKSRDIAKVIIDECTKTGVVISCGEPVVSVERQDGLFNVATETAAYNADCVVLATGGKSYPDSGSSGDGYRFAQSLGHTITRLTPALAGVIIKESCFGEVTGTSLVNVKTELLRNGNKIASLVGDVLFTHKGLSGPAVLNLSRYMLPGDILCVALSAFDGIADLEEDLVRRFSQNGRLALKKHLQSYGIPERLLLCMAQHHNLPLALNGASIDKTTRKKIADLLLHAPFTIQTVEDFRCAMVTSGGIELSEVNPLTMESRLCSGLYCVGEILDVDGDTGGYNLQFAFSSGVAAGRSLAKRFVRAGAQITMPGPECDSRVAT
jgi:predicted Rossmann fold flavoprotein